MSLVETPPIAAMPAAMIARFRRKRRAALATPVLLLAYFVYVFFAFDMTGIAARARLDNAAILLADFWSHKTHVTRDNRSGAVTVAIEGEAKGTYPQGRLPAWVTQAGGITRIDLGQGHVVTYEGTAARYEVPGYGVIAVRPDAGGIALDLPPGPQPDWISASGTRLDVTTAQGRFSVTRNRTEVFRYQPRGGSCSSSRSTAPIPGWGRFRRWRRSGANGWTRRAPTSSAWRRISGPTRCGGTATWPGHCSRPC